MPKQRDKQVEKCIKEILSVSSKTHNASLLQSFIPIFYENVPSDFLISSDVKDLSAIAQHMLLYVDGHPKKEKCLVRVYNPAVKESGWQSERTVVELNTNDSPFIFDSVNAAIIEKGYQIYEVAHPVVKINRNKNGRVTSISSMRAQDAGGSAESVMHFQISHIADRAAMKELEESIRHTLDLVSMAVGDWPTMMDKSKEILRYLEKTKLPYESLQVEEIRAFISWLIDKNYTFLGYREYNYKKKGRLHCLEQVKGSELGVFKSYKKGSPPIGASILQDRSFKSGEQPDLLEITKSSRKSRIHRAAHMDYISIKKFSDTGKLVGEFHLIGLFTSGTYYQSATLIPIIRDKIRNTLQRAGFRANSHNGKALLTIFEDYPRDELLQITEDELFRTSMGILELQERPQPKIFVRHDRFSRFASCIVFIPRERFNTSIRKRVQRILELAYDGVMSDYFVQLGSSPLARVQFIVRRDDGKALSIVDTKKLEKSLVEVTSSWVDGLHKVIVERHGERDGEAMYRNYVESFPEAFKNQYSSQQSFHDIDKMEEAYASGNISVELFQRRYDERFAYHLKIYHQEQITLSEILPILENMGFKVIDEFSFYVAPKHEENGMWIMHFRLKMQKDVSDSESQLSSIKPQFEEAVINIWHGEIDNDAYNKLILLVQIPWRDVVILRAYSKYLRQIGFLFSHDFMAHAIAEHPGLARMLVELFYLRFEKKYTKGRGEKVTEILHRFEKTLADVKDVSEDRIIRQFCDIIMATMRTNFFQKDENGASKSYVSLKLRSADVPSLPLPHPYVEVFVYSHDVEGIHLRGGKVARGGLRWSDRKEDFRTEILGLMKAQMVKNSVIVPVGSKGGFVVKNPVSSSDREAFMAQGIECYKTFLRGILDITDNIEDKKIIAPENVVRHDGDDPYLVVAADKGTATFSDIANGLSAEYGFWLGDAFASGGSDGYDHKKMGITARGAWVSVHRHFQEMGIDTQKDDFTVAGIGDMSGDVFGNGMLLSQHIRLVAAFNHMHIFIDPEPDAKKSYKERKRLFAKPRSGWSDYDSKIISAGGGIFDRSAKIIKLSKQIRKRFAIEESALTPDELIKEILKSEVDLLWNGGIGTYVKAGSEGQEDVGDKGNDAVRINADQLKCRVIGEGGNLGFTQLARIEYSLHGGRINTDAIDNSAGVDCSDHEVNMKIALRAAMSSKKLTLAKRNELLSGMTDDVSSLVLNNNFLQTQCLTICENQGNSLTEPLTMFMHALEQDNLLDRKIEFLPDEEVINTRRINKQGFTRPELSVLLAYSKMHLYNDLIDSNLPDDTYFEEDLLRYFPQAMQKKFATVIKDHPLRRELVATLVANSIVNRGGITFFRHIQEDTGMDGCSIARSYTVTRDAFGLRDIWSDIENLSGVIPVETLVALFLEVQNLLERGTLWFLRNIPQPLNISEVVASFRPGIEKLASCMDRIISHPVREDMSEKQALYMEKGVPKSLAKRVASLSALASACDIVQVAKDDKLPIPVVGQIYYDLGHHLSLGWLRLNAQSLLSDSYWDRLCVHTLVQALFDEQMRLTAEVITTACNDKLCSGTLDIWLESNAKEIARYKNFINALKKQEVLDMSMLTVTVQRIKALQGISKS